MIVVVNYRLNNIGSILAMFRKVGVEAIETSNAEDIRRAEKIVLPGVGSFDFGMRNLHEMGLAPALNEAVLEHRKPILGICLGLQLFTQSSDEGREAGLGWLPARTKRFAFPSSPSAPKIPHIGWNSVNFPRPHPLFAGLDDEARFYFVHSFHLVSEDPDLVIARSEYGYDFDVAMARDNILGVQFHPEKSHRFGLQLLRNFANWSPHART